jgi:hypothetical protein
MEGGKEIERGERATFGDRVEGGKRRRGGRREEVGRDEPLLWTASLRSAPITLIYSSVLFSERTQ